MGLVHAYKKGEVPASQVSQAVKDAAKSMKKKSTKKFASTKHKGLPNKVKSEYMNEDGHTDVASAERKLKLIMKDAMDTLNALRSLSNEDSLPSWWTDKITLAKDYVGKSRDYIMNPAESVNEKTISIGGKDLMKYLMKRFKMSKSQAIDSMKKHKMDMSFLKKESVNERISVSDERHFGKKGIIIMIDDNGEKVSAIFKDKKNAKGFNRNKPSDIKKLLQLAKKTKFPKAIDESINENYYVLSQKKGTTNKPEAEVFKSKILALRYAKSLEKTHVIMFLDKQSNMKNIKVKSESVNETPQKVAKLLIKYGNNPKDVKDMVKKHYKKAKKDRSKSTPSELAKYISFLSANESVNEATSLGADMLLGGIATVIKKAGMRPKTAKMMGGGFKVSKRDKVGFKIEVEIRGMDKKETFPLQFETERGMLYVVIKNKPIKLGKYTMVTQAAQNLKKVGAALIGDKDVKRIA